MKQIELRPAHTWDCDECGRENFCRGVSLDPSDPKHEQMLRESLDIEEWAEMPDEFDGYFMLTPEQVTCAHCGETFSTRDWLEEMKDIEGDE